MCALTTSTQSREVPGFVQCAIQSEQNTRVLMRNVSPGSNSTWLKTGIPGCRPFPLTPNIQCKSGNIHVATRSGAVPNNMQSHLRGTPASINVPVSSKKKRLYLPKREELLFLANNTLAQTAPQTARWLRRSIWVVSTTEFWDVLICKVFRSSVIYHMRWVPPMKHTSS